MDIADHVAATDATARYPGAGTGSVTALAYVALGLAGETSELFEKTLAGDQRGIVAEAGDVLWYCSRLHRECAIDPAVTFAIEPMDDGGDPMTDMLVAAGRIAELVKKALRDDAEVTAERRDRLVVSLTVLASAWQRFHLARSLDPSATARSNIDKLLDRKRRDVLAGSGDER